MELYRAGQVTLPGLLCPPSPLCPFLVFLRDSSSKALEFRTHHTVPLHPATVNCATKKGTQDWQLSL